MNTTTIGRMSVGGAAGRFIRRVPAVGDRPPADERTRDVIMKSTGRRPSRRAPGVVGVPSWIWARCPGHSTAAASAVGSTQTLLDVADDPAAGAAGRAYHSLLPAQDPPE